MGNSNSHHVNMAGSFMGACTCVSMYLQNCTSWSIYYMYENTRTHDMQ